MEYLRYEKELDSEALDSQSSFAQQYLERHPAAGEDMPLIGPTPEPTPDVGSELPGGTLTLVPPNRRKGPQRALTPNPAMADPLLTVEDVGRRLNVSKDWVWDHCWRKTPKLPVIRMGDGALRFRASAIEDFINERERVSSQRSARRQR